MTGAMYAAISGLKAHMNKLNVIGNNIANVNTYGYKTQRALFSDSIYTMLTAGSEGTNAVGATNPSQIGYGVTLSSVDLDMSSGTFSPTGRDMDCMIMGDGFFLVGEKNLTFSTDQSLTSLTLTRVGNFEFKADGYLSDANGNVVYGFMVAANAQDGALFSDTLQPIQLPRLLTQYVDANDNVLETSEGAVGTKSRVVFPQDELPEGVNYEDLPYAGMDSISIDPSTGIVTGTSKDTDAVITIGILAMGNVTNPNGVTHTSGPYYKAGDGAGDLQISLMGEAHMGADGIKILKAGDGEDDKVNENDTIAGLGERVVAFTHINGSQYEDVTGLSDGMRIYSAGTTSLMTGGLEMSKTDLATEISEMITTQRGYQANTRIITVTDSMLEELVNIKR